MTKRIGIYCRVSTVGQTTENQKKDLLKYCEDKNLEVFKIYEDIGVSGSKSSRPALDLMMGDLEQGLFDIVLCWKIDRLGRSLSDLISLLNRINEYNGSFVSMQDAIDLTTPSGVLLFQMLGAIGQFELSLIKSRVQAGLRRARAENIQLGRPKVSFDFEKAIEMRKSGKGIREISKELEISIGKVHKFLISVDVQKGSVAVAI